MPDKFNPAIFILIRFAMVAPFSDAFRDRQVARTWLAKRIPLFHCVSMPGLEQQTKQPTAVLIGLVEGLEKEAEQIIGAADAIASIVPAFQVIDGENAQSVMGAFRREMAKHLTEAHTHVITIRLDNDDAIHKDYISCVVEHFAKELARKPAETDFFASVVFGMQADGANLYTYVYPNGPFQARMEKSDKQISSLNIKGVYSINHTKFMNQANASLLVKQTPLWIQFIHGSNVANCVKGSPLSINNAETLLSDFNLTMCAFESDTYFKL